MLFACRPLHHNAHALRNVDYMVDEEEMVRMSRSAPPCDGESDLGEQLLLMSSFQTALTRQMCLISCTFPMAARNTTGTISEVVPRGSALQPAPAVRHFQAGAA